MYCNARVVLPITALKLFFCASVNSKWRKNSSLASPSSVKIYPVNPEESSVPESVTTGTDESGSMIGVSLRARLGLRSSGARTLAGGMDALLRIP
jgi:hypothetical protein